MPVIFDDGVQVTAEGRISLVPYGIYENAAVVLFTALHDTLGNSSGWYIGSIWDEDISTSVSDSLHWSVSDHHKATVGISMGVRGANINREVWIDRDTAGTEIYIVGYITHDEFVTLPEVMSEDRLNEYKVNVRDNDIEWNSGPGYGNVFDMPYYRQLTDMPPTAFLFDPKYGRAKTIPKSLANGSWEEQGYDSGDEVFNLSGFDPNGDCWVSSSIHAALIGYFITPIEWATDTRNDSPILQSKMGEGMSGVVKFDKTIGHIVASRPYRFDTNPNGLSLYRAGQGVPHYPNTDSYVNSSSGQLLVEVDEDTHEILTYSDEHSRNAVATRLTCLLTRTIARSVEQTHSEEPVITAPIFTYPADNIGAFHLTYDIHAGTYSFSDVGNLVFNYSGGAANADPTLSLGGVESSEPLQQGLHELLPEAQGIDSVLKLSRYACLYLRNISGVEDAVGVRLWVTSEHSDISDIQLGLDNSGVDGEAAGTATDLSVPDVAEFVLAVSKDQYLEVPILSAGSSVAVWFKRTYYGAAPIDIEEENYNIHVAVLNNKVM